MTALQDKAGDEPGGYAAPPWSTSSQWTKQWTKHQTKHQRWWWWGWPDSA